MTKHRRPNIVGPALLLAGTLVATGAAAADDTDRWLGPDKALHFGVSVGLAAGGYGASALVLERPWERALVGGSFSLTLGAGKELYDLSGHGDPSWKDFTWDVVGTAVGLGIALLVDAALSKDSSKQEPSRTARMAIRF
jgi:putative lipoprotein